MKQYIKSIIKWIDLNLEVIILVSFSIAMTIIVFAQVIMRYVFNSAFSWAEEISRYLFIWIIYLGISYSCRTRRHVRVMFFINRLSDTIKRFVIILGDFLFLFYCIVIIIYGIRLNIIAYQLKQYTAAIHLSYVFVYSSIVFASLLSSIRIIQNIVHKIYHWSAPIAEFERLEEGDYLFKK